jgi:hypothetical protein
MNGAHLNHDLLSEDYGFMVGGHMILEAVASLVDLSAQIAFVPTLRHVEAGHVILQDVLSLTHLITNQTSE